MTKQMQRLHLARDLKTALELAIVALAPTELVDRLALSAGYLEAFTALAIDDTSALPLIGRITERANQTLGEWRHWQKDHPPKATA